MMMSEALPVFSNIEGGSSLLCTDHSIVCVFSEKTYEYVIAVRPGRKVE